MYNDSEEEMKKQSQKKPLKPIKRKRKATSRSKNTEDDYSDDDIKMLGVPQL